MPDQLKARVLVIALLLLLAVAGLSTLGPAASLARTTSHVLVACVVLELVLAGLLVALRWQHRPPAHELAGKLHRIISVALISCMIGVLLVLLSLGHQSAQPRRLALKPARGGRKLRPPHSPDVQLPWLRYLLFALLIIALIAVVVFAWRRGLRLARRKPGFGAPDIGVDEAADELARAVESGRVALRDIDEARAAIIACYVAMEQSLAEAGAARGAAETPDELLVRSVTAGLVPRRPAALLTGLFYEARFSTHHMPASKRDQAERALTSIAASLPAREPA